jgi:hypothetical protein
MILYTSLPKQAVNLAIILFNLILFDNFCKKSNELPERYTEKTGGQN